MIRASSTSHDADTEPYPGLLTTNYTSETASASSDDGELSESDSPKRRGFLRNKPKSKGLLSLEKRSVKNKSSDESHEAVSGSVTEPNVNGNSSLTKSSLRSSSVELDADGLDLMMRRQEEKSSGSRKILGGERKESKKPSPWKKLFGKRKPASPQIVAVQHDSIRRSSRSSRDSSPDSRLDGGYSPPSERKRVLFTLPDDSSETATSRQDSTYDDAESTGALTTKTSRSLHTSHSTETQKKSNVTGMGVAVAISRNEPSPDFFSEDESSAASSDYMPSPCTYSCFPPVRNESEKGSLRPSSTDTQRVVTRSRRSAFVLSRSNSKSAVSVATDAAVADKVEVDRPPEESKLQRAFMLAKMESERCLEPRNPKTSDKPLAADDNFTNCASCQSFFAVFEGETVEEKDSSLSFKISRNERLKLAEINSEAEVCQKRTRSAGPVDVDDAQFVDRELNLKLMQTMAVEQMKAGDFDEALDIFREMIRVLNRRHGEDNIHVGAAWHNVGIVNSKASRFNEAVEACRKAIQIRKKALGSDHPDVAVTLSQLGIAFMDLGEHEAALGAFGEALSIRKKHLGSQHIKVAKILNNMGCVLFELKELSGAESSFKEALEIQRLLLTTDPPNADHVLLSIASTQCNIGSIQLVRKELNDAIALFEEALVIQQSVLGDDHKTVMTTMQSIEQANYQLKDKVEAEQSEKGGEDTFFSSFGATMCCDPHNIPHCPTGYYSALGHADRSHQKSDTVVAWDREDALCEF